MPHPGSDRDQDDDGKERLQFEQVDRSVRLYSAEGTKVVLLLVPLKLVWERMWDTKKAGPPPGRGDSGSGFSGRCDTIGGKLLSECLRQAASLVENRASERQLSRVGELLLTLLVEALSDCDGGAVAENDPSVPWYVAVAERYIAESAALPISMRELARVAAVSPRTLHEGFRKSRGYSPMQYLREQRMLSIRRELMGPRETTTVTEAAMKWGFNHLGRFSAYYAQQFGEMPSETLRMARVRTQNGGLRSLTARAS